MITKEEFKNWKADVEYLSKFHGKPVKVYGTKRSFFMNLCTFIIILEILTIGYLTFVSAGEIITIENKTLTININHNFNLTPQIQEYIDKVLEKYFGNEETQTKQT